MLRVSTNQMAHRWRGAPWFLTALLSTGIQAADLRIGATEFALAKLEVGRNETAFAAGDVNHDGHVDLLVADRPARDFIVNLGDGTGGFKDHGRFPAGPEPEGLTIADFDGDGHPDVVVANHEERFLTILRGDGRANFAPAANSPLTINVSPHPHAVGAHDLDGDGHLDLVVDHRDGEGLLWIRGLGGGRFESAGEVIGMGGDPYRGMAVGDINGDGRPDLATPNPANVGIALNTGDGHPPFRPARPVDAAGPFAIALADFDGDGVPDLVAASDARDSVVEMFRGDGLGGFARAGEPRPMEPGAKDLATGDFNGDGVQDLLVTSWSSDALIILGGERVQAFRFSPAGIGNAWGLAVDDFNEDGKDDFVIADGVRPVANLYLSR